MIKFNLNALFLILGLLCVANALFALSISEISLGSAFPLFFGIILIVYAIFRKTLLKLTAKGWLRKLRITIYFITATGVLLFATIISFILIGANKVDDSTTDAIVVLGAGLKDDIPTLSLTNRLNEAITYYENNKNAIIIVTGGQGTNEAITEAEGMKRYLLQRGIEESSIIMEDKATSTFENFLYTKEILDEYFKDDNYTIAFVTNDFHIFRSKFLASRVGLNFNAIPSPTPNGVVFNSYLREFFAVVKSFVFDRI